MELRGERIVLRSVDIDDVQTILMWENDPDLEPFSDPHDPYTEQQIVEFILAQQVGFEANGQIRLIIDVAGRAVGAVDIFDYDGSSADVGVLVYSDDDRRRGYATEALEAVKRYAPQWGIATLWATIDSENIASTALFRRCGFVKVDKNRYKYEQSCCSVNTFSRLR
ncbi:MAG: GNAT family N-acetyltransferase [Alistipes sp.]|nr:GNAT family N-acetyltransferase [Alistipes sp.]